MGKALEHWQVIGEGTDFITVLVTAPVDLTKRWSLKGRVLDAQGRSPGNITALAWGAEESPHGHLWLSFMLFTPPVSHDALRTSNKIELRFERRAGEVDRRPVIHVLNYVKAWGEQPHRIYDKPAPPDEIPGFLQLQDFTFFAADDVQIAQKPTLAGVISGSDGQWTEFKPTDTRFSQRDKPANGLAFEHGWLELSSGRTFSEQESQKPSGPHLRGWWDGKGIFHPQGQLMH